MTENESVATTVKETEGWASEESTETAPVVESIDTPEVGVANEYVRVPVPYCADTGEKVHD